MNEDILLSVIIPVYNTEEYLERCLDSVIKALKKIDFNTEVIVINDGSKGNVSEIIKEYLNEFPNLIRYIVQENKGRGATRNIGVNKSKGKYLHFVDSDDYVSEDIYNFMLKTITNDSTDIVICDFQSVDSKNTKKNCYVKVRNNNIKNFKYGFFDELILPACWNKIIKKDLFNGILFPEDINYEDLATIPLIVLKAKKIEYVPKMLYNYIQNENSVMNEKFGVNQLNIIKALEIICDRITNTPCLKEDIEKIEYMLCTRRYFEEILEKIALSKENKNLIVKEFCKKAKKIDNMLWNNEYFIELLKSQNRYKTNKILHIAIQKNMCNLLDLFLNKRLYYRYFAVRYKSLKED